MICFPCEKNWYELSHLLIFITKLTQNRWTIKSRTWFQCWCWIMESTATPQCKKATSCSKMKQRASSMQRNAYWRPLRRYHPKHRWLSSKVALTQQWVLLIGGTINRWLTFRISANSSSSYCGARYFKPRERDDEDIIKFTIQGQPRRKDDANPSERSQVVAGLATWYQSLPLRVFLIAPTIYSLVALMARSTAFGWLPHGWIGPWRKSTPH